MTNLKQSFIQQGYNFYKKIVHIGLSDKQTVLEQQRIKIINFIVLITISMELLMMVQGIVSQEWVALVIGIVLSIFSLLPLYFNSKHQISIAVWLFCLYSPLSMVTLICLFGRGIGSEYNFFIFAIHLIFFLSRLSERVIYAIYLLGLVAFINYFILHYDSPFVRDFNLMEQNLLFFTSLLFLVFVLKTYTDIVNRNMVKISELLEQQKDINKNLETKQATIAAQNKALQLSNEELEKFAYIASHDLKSPLRNVTSFLTLIDRKIKRGRFDVEEDIQFASRAAKQMYYLIEDILRFSSMKQQKLSFKTIDLSETLMRVVMRLNEIFEAKNAEIIVEELPHIDANQSQVELLFQNLIENSLKYNEQDRPKIEISVLTSDEFVTLQLKDNGIGIPMDYQKKVFEMFSRLHNQQEYEGSGLGLAICKRIVSAHNGDIWFTSDGMNGTTFFVKLPIVQLENIEKNLLEAMDVRA